MCARTGYTGEDGFELFVPAADAVEVWRLAQEVGTPVGLIPCGLSARDTLRLEAGMPLYGQELGRERTPFVAGLGRVVQFGAGKVLLPPGLDGAVTVSEEPVERGDFVGRSALEAAASAHEALLADPASAPADARILVGLIGEGRRSARTGYELYVGDEHVGTVTSGAPSPTLGVAIAMAYVHPKFAAVGTVVEADVRGRREPMTVTALPFYKRA
jgi:aminomethyltransferase